MDLYGNKSKRLYLHTDSLEFKHPITHKIMKFNRAADFKKENYSITKNL